MRRQSRKKSAREVLRCTQDYERTLATLRVEALPQRGQFREKEKRPRLLGAVCVVGWVVVLIRNCPDQCLSGCLSFG